MSRLQAKEIYRVAFWNRAKCDQFTGAISYQLFDAAVNHGIGNAIRMLQRAVGVNDDGAVGSITLGAIKKMTLDDVLVLFIAERLEFYTKLSTFNSFGRGWARRVVGNLRYAAGYTMNLNVENRVLKNAGLSKIGEVVGYGYPTGF